ncbi:MAG TPA: tetratricopeptide repeat protein [Phycisphaerae bacterium]|jgi:predicted Zn-dependent protease
MPTIDQIAKLLAAEPDDAFLNFSMAMQLAKEQRGEQALRHFDRVIQVDPSYTAAYHHKANTLIGTGRLDEARRTLEAGINAAQRVGNMHAQSEMQELLASLE